MFFYCLLFCSIIFSKNLIAEDSACATPTEYVMFFAAKSGSLWRGSQDWKKQLQNGNIHHTYIKMKSENARLKHYQGIDFTLRGLNNLFNKVINDNAEACFKIECLDNNVTIITVLRNTEVRKNIDQDELGKYKKTLIILGKEEDSYTKCDYITDVNFNEESNGYEVKLVNTCITKMPITEFLKQISEHESNK